MSDPILYIAGPMSGYPANNYPAFFAAEEQLRAVGFTRILNPVRRIIPADSTWEAFMRSGLRMVLDAEALVLLPWYSKSTGALWELDTAQRLGMPFGELDLPHLPWPGLHNQHAISAGDDRMTRRWNLDDVLCVLLALAFMAGLGWALFIGYTGGY